MFPLGSYKEMLYVYVMPLLVLSTNGDVVKAREAHLKIIPSYKLHHLVLETSYTVGDVKGQAGETTKVVQNLVICTSKINTAEASALGDLGLNYRWKGESVTEYKPMNGL